MWPWKGKAFTGLSPKPKTEPLKQFLFLYILTCLLGWTGLYQEPELAASIRRGQDVYRDACISCHLDDGSGVEGVYPPLAGSDYLMAQRIASIRGIKYGQRGPMVVNGLTYDNTMLPMGLSDQQIADVMNFIRNSWGNQTEEVMVKAEEVALVGPR